jgi:hypothetical protein
MRAYHVDVNSIYELCIELYYMQVLYTHIRTPCQRFRVPVNSSRDLNQNARSKHYISYETLGEWVVTARARVDIRC